MRVTQLFAACAFAAGISVALRTSASTTGVESLVRRRLPQHADSFQFELLEELEPNVGQIDVEDDRVNDSYVVSSSSDGRVLVQGNTAGALLAG